MSPSVFIVGHHNIINLQSLIWVQTCIHLSTYALLKAFFFFFFYILLPSVCKAGDCDRSQHHQWVCERGCEPVMLVNESCYLSVHCLTSPAVWAVTQVFLISSPWVMVSYMNTLFSNSLDYFTWDVSLVLFLSLCFSVILSGQSLVWKSCCHVLYSSNIWVKVWWQL